MPVPRQSCMGPFYPFSPLFPIPLPIIQLTTKITLFQVGAVLGILGILRAGVTFDL